MVIFGICSNGDILKIMKIIKIIINVIKILVPIILLVSVMIDYTKAVTNGELNNVNKLFKNKIIAAILIFFIPTFVSVIFKIADVNRDYYDCIENATSSGIQEAYIQEAIDKINICKNTFNKYDYNSAYNSIKKIKDDEIENELLNELNEIKIYVDIKDNIKKLSNNYSSSLYSEITESISNITDPEIKKKLEEELSNISGIKGTLLNVSSGFYSFNDGISGLSEYTLYIPENATTNMPLYVVLPASQYNYSIVVNMFKNIKNLSNVKMFILIPKISIPKYKSSSYPAIHEAMVNVINKYNIDKKRISATGFSSSGTYVYYLVYQYKDEFAAMVPMSSGVSVDYVNKDYDFWSNLPMKGFGEIGPISYDSKGKECCPSCKTGSEIDWNPKSAMTKLFKFLGKENDFTSLEKTCHSDVADVVYAIDNDNNNIPDIFEWLEKQSIN